MDIVCFFLGNSSASEFYMPTFRNTLSGGEVYTYLPMKMQQCSQSSANKIQTPGNCPEESIQHSERGESLKSRRKYVFLTHCGRVTQICVFNTVKPGTSASSPQYHSTRGNVSRGITPSSTTRVFGEYFLKISVHKNSQHPFLMFLDHTRRRSTVGRTPLDE